MASIADIRSRVVTRLKDAATSLDSAETTRAVDSSIVSAVEEYGKIRPAKAAAVVTGAATHKYSLTAATPVLTGFVDGFSIIESIVYPYISTSQALPAMEADEWRVQRLADGLYLWFTASSPSATEYFLAEFTKPHTCSASALTVATSDYEAVADLAASHALTILANFYVQSVEASISADSVNRMSKAAEYRSMAKAYRESYKLKMSSGAATGGALTIADVDRLDTPGRDYMFHGRRRF